MAVKPEREQCGVAAIYGQVPAEESDAEFVEQVTQPDHRDRRDRRERAMDHLERQDQSVQIHKLGGSTRLSDCSDHVLRAIGMENQRYSVRPEGRHTLVRDLPFPVWGCCIRRRGGGTWHYGKTLTAAVEAAIQEEMERE